VNVGVLVSLAGRGLRASRTFALLVIAVAIGAGFQISNTATLDGFEANLLDDALVHGGGDVWVTPRDTIRFDAAGAEVAAITPLAGAVDIVPMLSLPGAVAGRDRRYVGTVVWGVDASARRPPFRLVEGQPLAVTPAGPARISVLLGTALAARVEAKVGDPVELRVILGSEAGMPDAATAFAVHLDDHDAAGEVAARLEARPELVAQAWYDADPGWASYLGGRRAVGGISYAMVIAAIAIPMWALLYIHVLRRQRELAILAALGFTRGELAVICTLQSVFVATIGCVLGAGLGYALTRYFTANPLFAGESLVVRPALSLHTILVPCLILVGTSIVAALHPAWRAGRIEPAAVLRRLD